MLNMSMDGKINLVSSYNIHRMCGMQGNHLIKAPFHFTIDVISLKHSIYIHIDTCNVS